ncbi:Uncharacterised protein [Klebsiella aerogenes]|nr:Uncharacterised protein [Klebsiella aerogenes]
METLTVQAFLNAEWQDIALIKFPGSEQGDWFTTQIDYLTITPSTFWNAMTITPCRSTIPFRFILRITEILDG